MMSQEANDRITRIGPGTAAGAVLRRYWQPAALAEELVSARPVVPVTLLGERLVLFHDVATPSWIERPAPSGGRSQPHIQSRQYLFILPMPDNDLACQPHPRPNETEFTATVRRLVQIHEIHVDG